MSPIRPFPTHVPTLTEVVENPPIPEAGQEAGGGIVSDFEVEPPAAPLPQEVEVLTDEITASVSASLTPVLEQLVDQLMHDLQTELNHRLRELVVQAVTHELNKRRAS